MYVRAVCLCTALMVAACSSPTTEQALSEATASGFDEVEAGTLPPGLVVASGRWEVVEDASAPSGGRAMAQISQDRAAGFNVLLFDESRYLDVDMTVSFRSIAGEVDQGGGPIWRAGDGSNYYIARYNPLEDNYRVYVVVDGKRQQLQSADIAPTPGWHTLRITMVGELIRCFYDGELSLEVRDATLAEAGMIGLWTKADAQTYFDDVKVD